MQFPKEYRGYITVEASFVLPIIIGVFYLIIVGALCLFMRCYKSQNEYINNFWEARGGVPINVIYGEVNGYQEKNDNGIYIVNPLSGLEGELSGR